MNSIVGAVAKHALETPEILCMADTKAAYTYAETWAHVAGTAGYLMSQGIKAGDHVVIRNSQDTAYVIATLAIQLIGAVSVPLEKNVADARVAEICQETGAVLYLANKASEVDTPWQKVSALADHMADDALSCQMRELAEQIDAGSVAEILFSTGTTGKSKGIVLTYANNVAVAENIIAGTEMKKQNVELIPIPLSHSHALRTTYAALLNGSGIVLLDGVIFVAKVFSLMEKYQVTAIDLVPAALAMLLKLAADKLGEWNDRLDYIELGSAPIPEEDKKKLCELLPSVRLYNFYGSTESGRSCALNFNDGVDRRNCIGKPVPNAGFAFFDSEGRIIEASPEKPGLLGWSGSMNTPGYYKSPELNEGLFNQGYIVTQDLSYMGEDGLIYLLGRQGDVITCGGSKIAPTEVEEAADSIPGIAESACIPQEDPMLGQVPKLYYVLEKEASLTEQDIYEALKDKLEAYKIPRSFVKIDKLPRAYNGKLQRAKLK